MKQAGGYESIVTDIRVGHGDTRGGKGERTEREEEGVG